MLITPSLSGCGFRPLYGKAPATSEGADTAIDLAGIRVLAIADRLGQQLRTALVQRLSPLGEPSRPRHDLLVRLRKQVQGLGQQKDARATLGRMTIDATFALVDSEANAGGGDAVRSGQLSGTARAIVSFNYLGAHYASVTMERDAEERAVEELSESIRRQLAVHFAKARGTAGQ